MTKCNVSIPYFQGPKSRKIEFNFSGGFLLGAASFDHIIRGNTFILEDGKSPLLLYKTSDCGGIELENNRICGGTALASGLGKPQVDRNNRLLPRDAPITLS